MRKRADWMLPADDIILEFLEEEGQYPPKIIAEQTELSQGYVNRRCLKLADAELLRNLGRGLYQITDLGEQYLAGDLDAAALESDGEEDDESGD